MQSIISVLTDEEVVKDLQKKVSARRKKRLRLKKLKEKMYTKKVLNQQRIEEANKSINDWQKQELENLDKKLRVGNTAAAFQGFCWFLTKTSRQFHECCSCLYVTDVAE